jgi:DNA-binding response OmpR family regulator
MPEKVLIIDDDVETLRLVGMMLQRQGYEIAAANTGAQGMTMVKSEHPDLIVLDVMMPDMDGYLVTHQLREDPDTASIPILMFTAKSQVDDKVAGYEAGVDDYLTKPIHPAELVAHIKALLSRSKSHAAAPPAVGKGYTIGAIAPKGGLGVSSLILNLAISLSQKTKTDLVAAELRPGHGSWALELGLANPEGLNNLLKLKPAEITNTRVEKELIRLTFGPRLLLCSHHYKDVELINAWPQMEAVLTQLTTISQMVLLDIGASFLPMFDKMLAFCNELLLITEPYPATINRTKVLIEELGERGFGRNKILSLVIVNRVRADVQLSVTQVQEMLGQPISQVIPPAPELAFQAGLRSIPLSQVQPDGLVTQQYGRLAEAILQRIQK